MTYDMSAGIVKLDLESLIRMSAAAVKNARSQMNRYQGIIDDARFTYADNPYRSNHTRQFYANLLAESARDYANAEEAYFHLAECLTREDVTIVLPEKDQS